MRRKGISARLASLLLAEVSVAALQPAAPVLHGMPRSSDTTPACEGRPPSSVTTAAAFSKAGTYSYTLFFMTRILSSEFFFKASCGDEALQATPVTRRRTSERPRAITFAMRMTFIMFVLPGSPSGIPDIITTLAPFATSDSRFISEMAFFRDSSSWCVIGQMHGITPQTSESCRHVESDGVIAIIGQVGRE